MRHKIEISTRAAVRDDDDETIRDPKTLKKLGRFTYRDDTVLKYLDVRFDDADDLRGGYVRTHYDEKKKHFRIVVELDAPRKLSQQELKQLREQIEGQITDGIGGGCFAEIEDDAGYTIDTCPLEFKLDTRCVQSPGTAYRPREIKSKKAAPKKKTAKKKAAKKKATPAAAAAKPGGNFTPAQEKKNRKALFRLLNKERIDNKAVVKLIPDCGDLSSVKDEQFPFANLDHAPTVKLLLKAGINPNVKDVEGQTLTFLAACDAMCVALMIEEGGDVNRRSDDSGKTTPLFRAVGLGELEAVKVLLNAGADAKIKTQYGKSVLAENLSYNRDYKKIDKLLRAAGAKE